MSSSDLIKTLDADAASKGGPAGAVIQKRLKLPLVNYTYIKGEVVEYISNPANYVNRNVKDTSSGNIKPIKKLLYSTSNEEVENKIVDNGGLAPFMPANSIFVKINAQDPSSTVLAFPFFPSHFVMPLKVGERVWLLVENKGQKLQNFYWMCRVAGDRQSEDLNFTNVDNANAIRALSDAAQQGVVSDENLIVPALTPEKFKNPVIPKNQSVSSLQVSSVSFREEHTMEPVPRTHGKGPDFILQGSNNSTLHMTTEKFRPEEDISEQTFLNTAGKPNEGSVHTPLAGAIDLFVGKEKQRLRDLSSAPNPEDITTPGEFNVKLGSRIAGAQKFETFSASKIDEYTLGKENEREGNDSPRNVSSRLYLGMNASPDSSFGFQNNDFTDYGVGGSAILYGDHVRCFAENSLRLHVYPPADDGLSCPGGSSLDMANDGTITLQSGEGDAAAKIILRPDGNIIIKPGASGVLYLGGDETELAGVAVSVNTLSSPIGGQTAPQIPSITTTMGGTAFLGDPGTGLTSSKVLIKV